MSGHSKWSTIKHKKGAADARRGKLFSKLSRAIMVAAKEGGSDPASNLALQNAIDKARSYSMPKDNIERAIAKGTGEGTDGSIFETVVYEGYGPEGVAVIVEALTDNRNRTASDVRHVFTKFGGNLGATGAVAWQFERRGIVLVPADGVDEDELVLAAADAGAEDVERDGSTFVVTSPPEELARVREALEGMGLELESAGISMVPKTTVAIADESTAKQVVRLVEGLEELGRRAGRLRELRHPRGRAGGRGLLVRREACDPEPSAAAVERQATESVGACDERAGRAARHDRERSRREGVLGAVDDERSATGKRDERDVALRVHVLGLALTVAPDEERRVQLLARRSPRWAVALEREEVDDVHPPSVVEPWSCA